MTVHQRFLTPTRKYEVTQAYAGFCGIDVGKGEHHAVGPDPNGK
ncbi:hypothetical protein [Nocardia asteroides]